MDNARKLIVGYDLCEDYSQISCYSYKSFEPVPILCKDEQGLIPTALCVHSDTKQWLFGEEAVVCGSGNGGILVDRLLDKLIRGVQVEVFGQSISAVELMEKYFRKTLTLIKEHFPVEPITQMVVTVRNMQPALAEGIYAALELLGLEKDRVTVMSHAGAYLYYALSQDKALWINDVGLFDFSREGLLYYQMRLNRRSRPMIAGAARTDCSATLNYAMTDKLEKQAYVFETLANSLLHKQLVTTLYFTGVGFMGNWAEEVLGRLCAGRRVFLGQNLFTKGACYAAKELCGERQLENFILLQEDMITSDIGIRVYKDTKFKEVLLAKAGELWYEVNHSIEVILEGAREGEAELEIVQRNIMNRDIVREKLYLTRIPKRPDRMTRLELKLTFQDSSSGKLAVGDLGFGEFYPGTGRVTEFPIGL